VIKVSRGREKKKKNNLFYFNFDSVNEWPWMCEAKGQVLFSNEIIVTCYNFFQACVFLILFITNIA
jgi:hypothetical protein